jgi:hypothetical protein
MAEPGDEITWREACAILGVGMRRVGQLIARGELSRGRRWQHRQLPRAEVEALAVAALEPSHRRTGLLLAGYEGSRADARGEPGEGAAARGRGSVAVRADTARVRLPPRAAVDGGERSTRQVHAYELGA